MTRTSTNANANANTDTNTLPQSESNELVAQKAKAAIDAGIGAVVCIGEPLEVREAGIPALKKVGVFNKL